MDDVVNVTNGAFGERVGDAPRGTTISRRVDVNFFARGIVEVLSPEHGTAGNCRDVQRARSPGDGKGRTKLRLSGGKPNDRSRHRSDQLSARQYGERMEAVAKEASCQAARNRKSSLPRRVKAAHRLPL